MQSRTHSVQVLDRSENFRPKHRDPSIWYMWRPSVSHAMKFKFIANRLFCLETFCAHFDRSKSWPQTKLILDPTKRPFYAVFSSKNAKSVLGWKWASRPPGLVFLLSDKKSSCSQNHVHGSRTPWRLNRWQLPSGYFVVFFSEEQAFLFLLGFLNFHFCPATGNVWGQKVFSCWRAKSRIKNHWS